MKTYAELAVTTNFSFLRGGSHAEELVARATELGLAGIGIADRNSVAGLVRAHGAAKNAGLRIAPGVRLIFNDGAPDILAFPKNRAAWGRLTRLLTLGKRRAAKGDCILILNDLLDHAEGMNLIVLAQHDFKHETLIQLRETAPHSLWLAAAMNYRGDDWRTLAQRASLARDINIPLIAINDVLYHAPERRPLQDVLTCIREHVTIDQAGRRLEANAERHLKSPEEMTRLFRDCPQAIAETIRCLDGCGFSLDELAYEYPDETREGYSTPQEALIAFTQEGARRRFPDGVPDKVRRALDHELQLTAHLNFAPYFLTVHDIVRFARSQGILCQGRGSAANSAICYCLGVTEVDPERNDLLFERFISAERGEPPDIDVDFEHERREEVIQYIYRRYGRERAGIAATVVSYRARSAVREVGKVFGLSEGSIGALASTIWGWSSTGADDNDARRAGFDPADRRLAQVLALSRELMGFPRHLSQHVGGFVITRGRLDEVVPIENAAMEDRTFVEWDKDDLNDLGILKVDVLGLGMLTCLKRALGLLGKHYLVKRGSLPLSSHPPFLSLPLPLAGEVGSRSDPGGGVHVTKESPSLTLPRKRERGQEEQREREYLDDKQRLDATDDLDLSVIPPEDPAVYRMLQRADSIGVFQVESRAQISMLPRLKPDKFYDLVIEVAIVRPGPIQGDMVHPYLRRRQGLERVNFPSPAPEHGPADELQTVLGKTLGVPLFQEQAMRIAIVAAGFTPSEADRLRRAMATFRRVGTIQFFNDKLVEGMVARGYPRDFAARCFKQIEGFGEYGFPESHAASFAILVYASSWVKCHYPDVFACALLNAQPMGFYAPAQIVRDAQDHGVAVRPVDVNFSDWDCTLEGVEESGVSLSLPLPLAGEVGSRSGPGGGIYVNKDSPSLTLPRKRERGQKEQRECQQPCELGKRRLHPRHAAMANDIRTNHAVRLGFRQISGLPEKEGRAIAEARGEGFDSIRDLWLRTRVSPAILERLAEADAFRSLGLDRREALWCVRALRRSGDKDDLPLFARAAMPEREPDVALPPMRLGEHVIADYRHLKLSLKAHPLAFLRADLDRLGILRHDRLAETPSDRRVTVAGLVLVRQRPGTASGVIFMTLEDETGIANIIVWPKLFERYRPVVLGARLVRVTGKLQNEVGVIHIIAERIEDLSPLLRRLSDDNDYAPALARADEVKRGSPGGSARPSSREEKRLPAELKDVHGVMPKGRNFQ